MVDILVGAGSLFVEREVATHEFVVWIERYVPLTGAPENSMMANIHVVLQERGDINLAAYPLLPWGPLIFRRILIRTTNRIWQSPIYN